MAQLLFALSERLQGLSPLGDVAHRDERRVPPGESERMCRHLDVEDRSVLAAVPPGRGPEQDHGRAAARRTPGTDEIDPRVPVESKVDEIRVVFAAADSVSSLLERANPVELVSPALDEREEGPRQDVALLVVVDEKNPN